MFIVIAACLWALDGVVRRSLYHIPPVTIVFYEHFIGAVLLLPWAMLMIKKEKLTSELVVKALLVALFGGVLGTVLFTTALARINYIAFSVVFLLQKLQPVFAVVSAHVLLGEKISKPYAGWAGLALAAAFFVTFENGVVNWETGRNTITAALYAVGAAACWGLGTTLSKMLLNQVSSVNGTVLRFYGSTVLAFGAVFVWGQKDSFGLVGREEIVKLIYIALTTGLVAMVLYYRGLKNTQAKTATILELALPVMAVVIDGVVYGSFLEMSQYGAAGVLMWAMYRVGRLDRGEKISQGVKKDV